MSNPMINTQQATETTFLQNVNQFQEEMILCGERFIAHPTGALVWPAQNSLIVADLYLQSGANWSVLQKLGNRTQASFQLNAIKSLISTHAIKQVIAIGRSFRRLDDPYHLDGKDITELYHLQKHVDWIWVAGPMARRYPNMVGGLRMVKYEQAGLEFRAMPRTNQDETEVTNEIAAGMYPMARLGDEQDPKKETVLPCFVSNGRRLLMPAFGGQLAARNILGDEFLPLFGYDELSIRVFDQFKTFPIPRSLLLVG